MEHCKICNIELGGETKCHWHHIIPRAFGGEKGPVAPLCSNDHNILHEVATKIIAGNDYQDLVSGLAPDVRKKLLWYSSRVVIAYEATKNDPNKRTTVAVVLSAARGRKLDNLMKIFNANSRAATLEALIDEAHSRKFLT